jgi:hypothetical protein
MSLSSRQLSTGRCNSSSGAQRTQGMCPRAASLPRVPSRASLRDRVRGASPKRQCRVNRILSLVNSITCRKSGKDSTPVGIPTEFRLRHATLPTAFRGHFRALEILPAAESSRSRCMNSIPRRCHPLSKKRKGSLKTDWAMIKCLRIASVRQSAESHLILSSKRRSDS